MNFVNIATAATCVSVRNGKIVVKCKSSRDAKDCAEILNDILNNGKSVVSIDYMDFMNESGKAKYELYLVKDVQVDECSIYIKEIELKSRGKYIICIKGNISIGDSADVLKRIAKESEDKEQTILFGLIYSEIYQENVFDMYVLKEK